MPPGALYVYKSPVCTFWITLHNAAPGMFLLGADEEALGAYSSPESAADDVRAHVTGHTAWDRLHATSRDPIDLDGWTRARHHFD